MIIKAIRDIPSPIPVDESHTCFVSMTPDLNGGYHSAYREFTPDKPGIFRSDIYLSSVRYQHYTNDLELDGPSRLLRTKCEDPRAFAWRGIPYCVVLDETQFGFGIYNNVVINLITGECHNLTSDLLYDGKNWMPLPDGDSLDFIRSIDPWSLVEVFPNWICRLCGCSADGHHIGRYRGGAAASRDPKGNICGIGHKTISLEYHIPFIFSIGEYESDFEITDLDPVGFGDNTIIDPTTILPDGKILCCCSARVWNHPELNISMKLCEILE